MLLMSKSTGWVPRERRREADRPHCHVVQKEERKRAALTTGQYRVVVEVQVAMSTAGVLLVVGEIAEQDIFF